MITDDVLLIDLGSELDDTLTSMSYPTYRRHLHTALGELVEYHRPQLPPELQALARTSLELLDPSSHPSSAELDELERQWTDILEIRKYFANRNARALCFTLSHVKHQVTSRYYSMGSDLASALTSQVLVLPTPTTPLDAPHSFDTMADQRSPDVKMLRRLIDSAKAARQADEPPPFGYGRFGRRLWTRRDREAERIRQVLRDAGYQDFNHRHITGFSVSGALVSDDGPEPFRVAHLGLESRASARTLMEACTIALRQAGYFVRASPDDVDHLQVSTVE